MPSPLTPLLLKTLSYLRGYITEHSYSPTQNEIAAALGISRSTVQNRLNSLEKKGCIKRFPTWHRGIALIDPTN